MAVSLLLPRLWLPYIGTMLVEQEEVWIDLLQPHLASMVPKPRPSTQCGLLIRSHKLSDQWPCDTCKARINEKRTSPVGPSAQEAYWENLVSDPFQWWNTEHTGTSLGPDSQHTLAEWKLEPEHTVSGARTSQQPGFESWFDSEESRRLASYETNVQLRPLNKLCKEQHLTLAVQALDLMVQKGTHIDDSVFYGVLKRCIAHKDLVLGKWVHLLIVKSGYESNAFLANHIICMYASHKRLEEAMWVFGKVSVPCRYMWASIILAHARNGRPIRAIELYRQLRISTLKPDNHIFVAVLKACAAADELASGKLVHADILEAAGKPDMFVLNCLVDMYAKCGSLEEARRVFDNLPTRDVVTWNAMIAGYAQHGLGQEAIALYESMQQDGIISVNHVTFVCILKACGSVRALQQGRKVHAQIEERGLEVDVIVGNCMVDMYSKCGSLQDARRVFDNMPVRDVVTWNSMMTGYSQNGLGEEALTLYATMQLSRTPADHVTFSCLLQACVSIRALHAGKQLHEEIQEKGLNTDVVVGSCLVDLYAKCGSIDDARSVFDNLPNKNVVTWTAMIAGYTQCGLGHEALKLYETMQQEGITPADAVTFICLLQACASVRDLNQGKQLHAKIKQRRLESEVAVGSGLVNMYAKCGSLEDASSVFENLPCRNVVTWTAMIAAYSQHGLGQDAVFLYERMQKECITPADAVTFICLLQACGSVAGLEKGKAIHTQISQFKLEATNLSVANALIDMYGKCGSMVDAQQIFDALPRRDVVTWSALIAGYARQGETELVFNLFARMMQEGMQPDGITFLSVLAVCSHAGLVDKGQLYFDAMSKEYGIAPTIEHYNCMVDLLGRVGQVKKAIKLVQVMPFQSHGEAWRSILGACQKWSNVELGREAFECAVRLDASDVAAYVLMSNIYAAAEMWEEVEEIYTLRVRAQAWKKPGLSWFCDTDGIVHIFVVEDTGHPHWHQIYSGLGDLYVILQDLRDY